MTAVESMILARIGDGAGNAATPATAVHGSRPTTATQDALTFGIADDVQALAALAPEWNALFETAGAPHRVFQSFGFVELWARTFLGPDQSACRCRLAIITARRAGKLVLVWPLVVQRKLGHTVLSWLGEPVAQYADLLIDPAEPALPLMQAAYAHARHVLRPDVLRLRRVRHDAAIMPLLRAIGTHETGHVEAPFVTLGAGTSSAGFEDRQSGKAKKNRRRLMRRLEEQGKVEIINATGTGAAAALVDRALVIKRDWAARRGLFAPSLTDPRFDTFMRAAAQADAAATGCAVFSLSLDGRAVAIAVGFVCNRRLMLHLITHAEDVEKCGAGILNLEAILRLAEAHGLEAVDMLPPVADYKLQWADGATPVCDHTLGLTPVGRCIAATLDGIIKPLAKRSLERLPLGLRQRMTRRQFAGTQK